MRKKSFILLSLLWVAYPSVSRSATSVIDSWDNPSRWTVTSPAGTLTQVTGCETGPFGSCPLNVDGATGNLGVCPPEGTHQGRATCPGCIAGEGVTILYTEPTPITFSGDTYIALNVLSCGTDRFVGMQAIDSGGVSYRTQPSSNACRGSSSVGGGGVTVGQCKQNVWDTIVLDITSSGLSDIKSVRLVVYPGELADGDALYLDNLRVMDYNPCNPTPTPTFTPTPTRTLCVDGMGTPCTSPPCVNASDTPCTPPPTVTSTFTFTPTFTSTPTSTPWPIMVFPNPMDFQLQPPNDNFCPSGMQTAGCIKFIGLPRGSTLTIYTVALAKVRSYLETDIQFPIPVALGAGANTDVGWIAWNGDNEDLNPVSPGLYFFVVEPPAGEKFIGKLAISRARKVN